MTSQGSKTVSSPDNLYDDGHSLPIYLTIVDTPGQAANTNTDQDSPSNQSNPDSKNVYESLTIAPVCRVPDSVPTCTTKCSRERRIVAGIAMSTLVLGLLLGFLPMYFVWASGGLNSCPTGSPEIPSPKCGPEISCSTCGPYPSCPPGFAQSPLVSRCYRFVWIPLKWEEARDHCRSVGGVLLELTNLADLRGIVTLVTQEIAHREGAIDHIWTGGLRVEPNVSGSPFRWDASGEALPRDSPLWNRGEPNYEYDAPENYVKLLIWEEAEYRSLNDVIQQESFSICESPLLA